jgi:hypothetical protein
VDPHLVLNLGKVAVELAAKADEQAVVGEFQKCLDDILGRGRRGQRADAQWELLIVEPGVKSAPVMDA